MARIRALLRRAASEGTPQPTISAGDLVIDLAHRRVTLAGREVDLTPTEYEILKLLATNANCVVTNKMVLERVWGEGYGGETQTLRVHVSNLRKKIESHPATPRYIITEPGVGFRFVGE